MVIMSLFAAACYNAKTGDTEVYGVARFKLPVVPETGSHRVMVFSEMHYQPKFESQDVPRLLPGARLRSRYGTRAAVQLA